MQQKPRVQRPWPLLREGAESELLVAFERPLQILSDECQSQDSGMRRPSLPLDTQTSVVLADWISVGIGAARSECYAATTECGVYEQQQETDGVASFGALQKRPQQWRSRQPAAHTGPSVDVGGRRARTPPPRTA